MTGSLLDRAARRLRRRLRLIAPGSQWDTLRALPRFQAGVTTINGSDVYYVDAASCASAGRAIFESRIYDFPSPDENRPVRIVDCGGNIGLGVLFWARRFERLNVTVFEPDPVVFDVLNRNVAAWGGKDVELINAALGGAEGTMRFLPDHADGGRLLTPGETADATVEVPVARLGPHLDGPVDLLKLDIEGAEADVLLDVQDCLKQVARVFVEVHSFADRPQRLGDVVRVLDRAGFRIFVQPEYCPPKPFIERRVSYGMDNRINLFAVRAPS